jgi:hypothetical protein
MEVAPTMQEILGHEVDISGTWIHNPRVLIASSRWKI